MERHHRAGSVVSFSLKAENDIFFRFYLTKAELLALTAADINLMTKQIDINKTYQRLNGKDITTPPKTKKSRRKIPIPDFLCQELQNFINTRYMLDPNERLFPATKHFLSHEMERGCKKTGVKRIRIHDIRHSYVKPTTKNIIL